MDKKIAEILGSLKIDTLKPMQDAALKANVAKDLILLAPTGSGKTLGFLLPLIRSLIENKGSQAIVIVPSRELALQITDVIRAGSTGLRVVTCYGGHSGSEERKTLINSPVLIVGTPGRIADHIDRGVIITANVRFLVLDEFDKSLELGFKDEMAFIVRSLKALQRRILTSATDIAEIPDFTGVQDPVRLVFDKEKTSKPAALKLRALRAHQQDKPELLLALLSHAGERSGIIFCNHRDAVERITQLLKNQNVPVSVFHGGMEQEDRERQLIRFRNGSSRFLVCTDLASRGLDIPEVAWVIHYQLPATEDVFIHRNGRTARMDASGESFLLLAEEDHLPRFIENAPAEERMKSGKALPGQTNWSTLYIGAGRKEKISKMDIVGMLLQKGELNKDELGKIELLDHSAYVAVSRKQVKTLLAKIRDQKMKGRKIRISEL